MNLQEALDENKDKLQLSREEAEKFKKAFQQEEFVKLFKEYMDEISDPKNRQVYEAEIAQLEAERGNKIQFLHQKPGFVIKCAILSKAQGFDAKKYSVEFQEGKKVFINVCSSDLIEKPQMKKVNGGQNWSLPYSIVPPRDDFDKSGKQCTVFDCVFHPETLSNCEGPLVGEKFKQMVCSTAIEGVQSSFNIIIKKEYKVLQMKYKGVVKDAVFRSKTNDENVPPRETTTDFLKQLKTETRKESPLKKETPLSKKIVETNEPPPIDTPVYKIIHQEDLDYGKFTQSRDSLLNSSRPKFLKIVIDLPRIASAKEVNLDMNHETLKLSVPNKYLLDLKLPFPVFEDESKAKFDVSKKQLTLTIPVQPKETIKLADLTPDVNETSEEVDKEGTTEIDKVEQEIIRANEEEEEEERANIKGNEEVKEEQTKESQVTNVEHLIREVDSKQDQLKQEVHPKQVEESQDNRKQNLNLPEWKPSQETLDLFESIIE